MQNETVSDAEMLRKAFKDIFLGVEGEFEEGIESSGLLMHGNLHSEALYGKAEECAQRCPYHAHLRTKGSLWLSHEKKLKREHISLTH